MQWPEMRYKGFVLAPGLAEDDGMYALELAIRSPDGRQQSTGVLGDFPCPIEALRFAFQYGMAQIDHQPLPSPDWTVEEWHDRHSAGSTWMLSRKPVGAPKAWHMMAATPPSVARNVCRRGGDVEGL